MSHTTHPYAALRRAADRCHEAESWRVRADLPHAADRPRLLLESLDLIAAATADLETMTRDTVDELRDTGASWSTIAGALGVSKQAAAQRFGRRGDAGPVDHGPTLLDELVDDPAGAVPLEAGAAVHVVRLEVDPDPDEPERKFRAVCSCTWASPRDYTNRVMGRGRRHATAANKAGRS